MAHDLERYRGGGEDDTTIYHRQPTPDREGIETARADAEKAARRHDTGFKINREADAGEAGQGRWDWGDARSWAIIWAMFLGFLLFCWFVYSMPTGTHTDPPPIRVY